MGMAAGTASNSNSGNQELTRIQSASSCSSIHKEELKVLHLVVDLMPYLHSQVHDLFKFYPSKTVMREKDALFTHKVGVFKFPIEEMKSEDQ
jgi:hypothetical protein